MDNYNNNTNNNNNNLSNSQDEPEMLHYSTIYEQEEEDQEHYDSTNNNNKNKKDETIDIEAMAAAITAAVQSSGRGTSSMALGNASIISNRVRSQSESTRSTIRRSSSSSSSSSNNNNNKRTIFLPNNNNRIIPQDAMAPRPKRSSSMSSQHSLPPSLINSTSTSTRSRSSSSASRHNYSARFSWLVGPSTMANNNDGNQQGGGQQQTRVGQEPTIMEEEKSVDPSIDDGRRELLYRGIQVKEMKTTLKTMVIPHEVENPMPKVELQRPGFARINY